LSNPYLRRHASSLWCATTNRFVSLRQPLQPNRTVSRRRTHPYVRPIARCVKPTCVPTNHFSTVFRSRPIIRPDLRFPPPNTPLCKKIHLPTRMKDNFASLPSLLPKFCSSRARNYLEQQTATYGLVRSSYGFMVNVFTITWPNKQKILPLFITQNRKVDASLCTILWFSIAPHLQVQYQAFTTCYGVWEKAKKVFSNDVHLSTTLFIVSILWNLSRVFMYQWKITLSFPMIYICSILFLY